MLGHTASEEAEVGLIPGESGSRIQVINKYTLLPLFNPSQGSEN